MIIIIIIIIIIMIAELIVCHTIESHRCGSRRFDRCTAGLHQAVVSTDGVTVKVAPWFVLIGGFRSSQNETREDR